MKKKTRTGAEWLLAGYYCSVIYKESADRGFRPINLNIKFAGEFMIALATGKRESWDKAAGPHPDPMGTRLSKAFLNLIWSRRHVSDAHDRVDMERLAEAFMAEHRMLFAELVLVESGEFPNTKIPVGGQPITLIPKARP